MNDPIDWKKVDPQYIDVLTAVNQDFEKKLSVLLLGDEHVGKRTFISNCCFHGISSVATIYGNTRLALFPNDKALVHVFYPEMGDLDITTKSTLYPHLDGAIVFFDLTERSTYERALELLGELIRVGGKMLPVFFVGTRKDIADIYHREVTKEDVLLDTREIADCSVHRVPYAEIATSHCHGYEEILVDLSTMMLCPYASWCNDRPGARRHHCPIQEYRSYYDTKLPVKS
jgi:hypothetical protein